eukprot:13513627-Alexandrium_andersonii.AAC.1
MRRAAWPAGLPGELRNLAVQMAEQSPDQLLSRPDSLVQAVMEQWQADGGESLQEAVDAALLV